MKIVISGSTGFIGKHLTQHFLQLGHEVCGIPRHLLEEVDDLQEWIIAQDPTIIIHCAAYGNMSYQQNEDEIIFANIYKTYNLLKASKNLNYLSFINIGSSSEYGKKTAPMRETDPVETDTFYGASKVAGTYLCRAFAKKYNKPIVTVRPFSVYGEGEAEFRFIPTLCTTLLHSEEMSLDEEAVHDWIHIKDFLHGIEKLISHTHELSGQVVNLGTGFQYTNKDVLTFLEGIAGKKVQFTPTRTNHEHEVWEANIEKITSLGWWPQISLLEGLRRVYEYEKCRPKKKNS